VQGSAVPSAWKIVVIPALVACKPTPARGARASIVKIWRAAGRAQTRAGCSRAPALARTDDNDMAAKGPCRRSGRSEGEDEACQTAPHDVHAILCVVRRAPSSLSAISWGRGGRRHHVAVAHVLWRGPLATLTRDFESHLESHALHKRLPVVAHSPPGSNQIKS
jgi:hypothetical protein